MSVVALREAVEKLIKDKQSSSNSQEIGELRTTLEYVNNEVLDITNTINSVLNPTVLPEIQANPVDIGTETEPVKEPS